MSLSTDSELVSIDTKIRKTLQRKIQDKGGRHGSGGHVC